MVVVVAIKPQHLQWMLQGLSEGLQPIPNQTGLNQYIHPAVHLLALRPFLSSSTIFSLAMEVVVAITTLIIILRGHQAVIVVQTTM